MSASTRTIQRPMGQGSIFGAIAFGAFIAVVVGALAWGALNVATSRQAATPHVSTTYVGSGIPVPHADAHVDPSSVGSIIATSGVASAPQAAPIKPFDIDSAHTVPYVDRFAPVLPETVFDRAHVPPYVDQLQGK